MKVAFRVDASYAIGTGHVIRCITLADALRCRGAECFFICRPHKFNCINKIAEKGYQVLTLPELTSEDKNHLSSADWLGTTWMNDAKDTLQILGDTCVDWLIVDHYSLDALWERAMKTAYKQLMVIDDLANRPHFCKLLLDQNLGRSANDYLGLVGSQTSFLIGPEYALLRPEFLKLRAESLARRVNSKVKRLLISMGGVDKDNVTGQVLGILNESPLPPDLQIDIVMGSQAPWLTKIKDQANRMKFRVSVLAGVGDMAALMKESDLAIGAAGCTAWERCCVGLPTLVIAIADNQREGALALQKRGAAISLQSLEDLRSFIQKYLISTEYIDLLDKMSIVASQVVDGRGVDKVADRLMIKHV